MSLFICAHGELYSKCKYCSEFDKVSENELEKQNEEKDVLITDIIIKLRKERIEY